MVTVLYTALVTVWGESYGFFRLFVVLMPHSVMDYIRSDLFRTENFDNIIVKSSESDVEFRTNVSSEEELAIWKELYSRLTKTSLNIIYTRRPDDRHRNIFSQKLQCHFAVKGHKGVKKHGTG